MITQKTSKTALIVGVLCLWHATSAFAQNLLVNGDFEAGNAGFTSDYSFVRLDSGLLTYDIIQDPSQSHFLGASFGDHTSGGGLMFAANGGSDTDRVVWRQVVSVVENTSYQFSGWAAPAVGPSDPDPSRISISINSSRIRPDLQLSNPPGNWNHFSTIWKSDTSSVATIELRLETTEQGGNDPALDDLRFEVAAQQISGFASIVAPAPAGLIGWWSGDGNVNDLAANDDGVPTNISFASGQVGPAFRFLGTDSYVRVPNQPAFNAITNITLECWVLNDPIKPFRRLLTLTPDWVRLALDENAFPTFTVAGVAGNQVISVRGDNPVTANAWHHIAGTFDGLSTRLYLDGAIVAVQATSSGTANAGAAPEVYINYLQTGEVGGLIDEAAIYNRALTAEEIRAHFVAGSAGMAKLPVFTAIELSFPGTARISIKGQAGKVVAIQSSPNFLDWVTLATDPNLTGTVNYIDSSAGSFSHRFYRAVAQ